MAKSTNNLQNSTFAVLGAGSWGTALALHLSRLGHGVNLWTFEKEHAEIMQEARMNNRYLPHLQFPGNLAVTADLMQAVKNVHYILIAVPSIGFRPTIVHLQKILKAHLPLIITTKGLDEKKGQLLHSVVKETLGEDAPLAVLSGPSFAKEVAEGLPTAVVLASEDRNLAENILKKFSSSSFRVYLSTDIIGVEIGGIVKNVLAIATGISDGMGFGANARCALITRGLAEMVRLGCALGGNAETFQGLAGLGDLILTCTDDKSRNRRFGLCIGQGKDAITAEKEIGQIVEGKRNTRFLLRLAEKAHIEMPIVEIVYQIIQGNMTPQSAMEKLFSRAPKCE